MHRHHNDLLSLATTHVHLDEANCLEVTLLRGRAGEISHFAEHLTAERGIRHSRVVVMAVEGKGDRPAPHHPLPATRPARKRRTAGSGRRQRSGQNDTAAHHVGLETLESGTIIAFDRPRRNEGDLRDLRQRVGFLFQHSDDQLFAPAVIEDAAFGPLNLGFTSAQAIERARAVLADLDLRRSKSASPTISTAAKSGWWRWPVC